MGDGPWTTERVDELRRHIADKLSGGATADAMGLRRNQVVGKAFRMGLKFLSVAGHKQKKSGGRSKGSFGSRFMPLFGIKAKFPYRDIPEATPQMETETIESLNLTIHQLTDVPPNIKQCRWPMNDDIYALLHCGLPVASDGCSWCSFHRKMAYPRPAVKAA